MKACAKPMKSCAQVNSPQTGESRGLPAAAITGATGMLGLVLIRLHLAAGMPVLALVRPGSPRASRLPVHPLVTVSECPLSALAAYDGAPPGKYGVFYHLAWEGTFGSGRDDARLQYANIGYTLDAAELAARLGCRAFVGAGSQAEYGRAEGALSPDTPARPETGYGIAKLAAGRLCALYCRRLGVRHVWARILSVYGPGDGENTLVMSVIHSLLRGERPACTAGEQLWDYLYCDDAARALMLMGERGRDGAVYPLGSGEAKPLAEYIRLMRDAVDPSLEVGLGELPYPPGQVMFLKADTAALFRDTGFKPAVSFEEGIRRTVDWCREDMGI